MQKATAIASCEPSRSVAGHAARVLFVAAILLLSSGCRLFLMPEQEPTVTDVIQSVEAVGAVAGVEEGEPSGDPGAPSASASGNQSMIPGGGTGFTISADEPFDQIYAWVDGEEGHYRIDLDSPQEEVELIVVYGSRLDESQYNFRFAVGNGAGAGPSHGHLMAVINVGTGEVQISVSWDAPSDVDLYVVDPAGDEIFYGQRTSASGGELDLDSNAACSGEDARNENVTWPDGAAPSGEYTVRVNYWDDCGESETNWVVTIRQEGQSPRSYTGTFTGSGTGGTSGAGEVVTTFNH